MDPSGVQITTYMRHLPNGKTAAGGYRTLTPQQFESEFTLDEESLTLYNDAKDEGMHEVRITRLLEKEGEPKEMEAMLISNDLSWEHSLIFEYKNAPEVKNRGNKKT
jgi:hypothetical protein